MGGVGDWDERENEIGIFSRNCFTELERRKPFYVSKGGYFTLNFKNIFVLTIILNTKHLKK